LRGVVVGWRPVVLRRFSEKAASRFAIYRKGERMSIWEMAVGTFGKLWILIVIIAVFAVMIAVNDRGR